MDDQRKKILIIIAFIFVVVLAGFLLWRIFQSTLSPEPDQSNNPNVSDDFRLPESDPISARPIVSPGDPQLPLGESQTEPAGDDNSTASDRTNKISSPNSFPTISATASNDGNSIQYYDPLDNKFYRLNDNDEPIAISDEAFYNVKQVNWSPDKASAVLEYPDGNKVIYNFQTKNQITLPKHWEDFEYAPSGDRIAFKSIGFEEENRWLSVMNADGSQAVNLEKLGQNADKATVNWSPNGQIIATFQDGYDYNRKEVFFIGLNRENFKSMLVQGRGFQSKWSPSSNKMLYSVYSDFNGYRPSLWLTDADVENIGANTKPLALETWVDKCTFASETKVYCAVPRSLDDGDGLLPSSRIQSPDDLYLIDLESDARTLISVDDSYNMSNLIVTQDGQSLFFTDQKTGGLYKIPLTQP